MPAMRPQRTWSPTLVIPVADATSMQHLIGQGGSPTTSLGRQAWLSLTSPPASPQLNCNAEGINQQGAGSARVRIGLLTSATDCTSAGSATGFGIETSSCGQQLGPAVGSAAGGTCGPNGSDVADFGYLFVR
jgi:hypothetical protein